MLNRSYEDLKRIYFQEEDEPVKNENYSKNVLSIENTAPKVKDFVKETLKEPEPKVEQPVIVEKNEPYTQEKAYLLLGAVLSILLSIIPSLALIIMRQDISKSGKVFLYKTLNFELVLILAFACVKLIPIYGNFIAFGLFLLNFISCIRAANALNNNKDFDYPIALNFINAE